DIERKYRIPFYPLTPILGIVTSMGLALYQYRFQPMTWYISLAWMAIGLILYFSYFRSMGEEPAPLVVEAASPTSPSRKGYRVLVPINDPATVEPLMNLAIPLAKDQGGEIVALSLVIIPRQLPIAEGMKIAHHQRPLLRRAVEYGRKHGVEVRTDLRIAHRTSQGILAAAEEEGASFILMEWRGYARKPRRVFGVTVDIISRQAPCDLGLVKFGRNVDYKRILLPTAGGPHARLASRLVSSVAERFGASVTTAYVIPKDTGPEGRERAMAWIDKTLEDTGLAGQVEKILIESESVAAGIVRAAKEYDLVVIGAAKEKVFAKILFGVIPERVARHSSATVLIIKGYEGRVKGWFKKVFG
ncbi:MAG: universal stress protein, partial [Nitrospinota bacterium]